MATCGPRQGLLLRAPDPRFLPQLLVMLVALDFHLHEGNTLFWAQSFFDLFGPRVGNLLKTSDAQKKISQKQHGNKNNFIWLVLLLRERERCV